MRTFFAEMEFVAPPDHSDNSSEKNSSGLFPDTNGGINITVPTTTLKFTTPNIPKPFAPTVTVTLPR